MKLPDTLANRPEIGRIEEMNRQEIEHFQHMNRTELEGFQAALPADIKGSQQETLGALKTWSAEMLTWLRRKPRQKEGDAETNRQLDLCLRWCSHCGFPPPIELVELNAYQLRIVGRRRSAIRDEYKWAKAAEFVAGHPRSYHRAVARAPGVNMGKAGGHKTVKIWREQPEFQRLVEKFRSLAVKWDLKQTRVLLAVPRQDGLGLIEVPVSPMEPEADPPAKKGKP